MKKFAWLIVLLSMALILVFTACGCEEDCEEEKIVEVEVIKEVPVPVEKIVEVEVEVPVEKIVEVEVEVIKELPVEVDCGEVEDRLRLANERIQELEEELAMAPETPLPPVIISSASSFDELVAQLNTPEKIVAYLNESWKKEFHKGCISYAAEEFFESGNKGDFKDYATFVSYVLAQNGYEAEILTFAWYDQDGKRYGYIAVVFRDTDGSLKYIKNEQVMGPISSITSLIEKEKIDLNVSRMGEPLILPASSTEVCPPD